jgi:hypothetical protein
MFKAITRGAIAGAAGTTALNTVTYLDMVWRARPASQTPQQTVEKLADLADVDIPGYGEDRDNRLEGLGPLSGIAAGVGVGIVAGLLRPLLARVNPVVSAVLLGGAAMAATDLPMKALGITDPATWAKTDWVADAIPHLVYGAVATAALRRGI